MFYADYSKFVVPHSYWRALTIKRHRGYLNFKINIMVFTLVAIFYNRG